MIVHQAIALAESEFASRLMKTVLVIQEGNIILDSPRAARQLPDHVQKMPTAVLKTVWTINAGPIRMKFGMVNKLVW